MKALATKAEQFVTDSQGTRIGVMLDLQTYQRLRDAEDELADIRAYDRALPKVRRELATGQAISLRAYRAKRPRKGA